MNADNILWFTGGMVFVGLTYYLVSVFQTRKLKSMIRRAKLRKGRLS